MSVMPAVTEHAVLGRSMLGQLAAVADPDPHTRAALVRRTMLREILDCLVGDPDAHIAGIARERLQELA